MRAAIETRINTMVRPTTGCVTVTHTTKKEMASSERLSSQLLNGSGLTFAAALVDAFAVWAVRAMLPPASAAITCHWGSTFPTTPYASNAPAAGRITVWIPSHRLSNHGILSATNSTRNITAAARMTGIVDTTWRLGGK